MTQTVTLSRPLPMPPVAANGAPVTFLPVASVAEIPEGTRVHCATVLDPLPATAIAALPASVRLIANIGVGTDNIDLAAAAARGIAVSNTPVVTEDTADFAFALILAACRKIGANERFLRDRRWNPTAMMADIGLRVHGRRLGLIGMGPIAQAVARRARGFDMPLLYWNRSRRPDLEAELGLSWAADPDMLVAGADIVSLHCALTPETRRIIDAARLARFRPGAVLINTGRGALVDEAAVAMALETGQLAAAGLDVFEAEPAVTPALLAQPNALLTPHIGSATAACRAEMAGRALANITAFLETGRPLDRVGAA